MGTPGLAGATGPTGGTGAPGAEGPQGLQGPAGAVLVIDGGVVTGPPGASVLVTSIAAGGAICPAGGIRVTQLSDGGLSNVCNGIAGATGSTGAAGLAGTNGMSGANGTNGVNGATGATGSTGATGPAGSTGVAGPAGDAGTPGLAGPQGPQGPQGAPGAVVYLDGGAVVQSPQVQFAGFTSALYTGNLGSATGANGKCQTEFSGSYFCTIADFDLANTGVVPPASTGAWIDAPRAASGERSYTSCASAGAWTFAGSSVSGAWLNPTGSVYSYAACQLQKPLSCCRGGGAGVIFRGYTSSSYTGNLGGSQGANQKCQSQYAGSYFCTISDFDRANTAAVPAVAAWVDAPRQTTGQRDYASCASAGAWTFAGNSVSGSDLNDAGTVYSYLACQLSLPLACCQNQ